MYLMVQDLNHLDNEDLIFTNLLDLAAWSTENVRGPDSRSVRKSHHPSHSVIYIIVDCFSVKHELPAFLFNELIILLIYLF